MGSDPPRLAIAPMLKPRSLAGRGYADVSATWLFLARHAHRGDDASAAANQRPVARR